MSELSRWSEDSLDEKAAIIMLRQSWESLPPETVRALRRGGPAREILRVLDMEVAKRPELRDQINPVVVELLSSPQVNDLLMSEAFYDEEVAVQVQRKLAASSPMKAEAEDDDKDVSPEQQQVQDLDDLEQLVQINREFAHLPEEQRPFPAYLSFDRLAFLREQIRNYRMDPSAPSGPSLLVLALTAMPWHLIHRPLMLVPCDAPVPPNATFVDEGQLSRMCLDPNKRLVWGGRTPHLIYYRSSDKRWFILNQS